MSSRARATSPRHHAARARQPGRRDCRVHDRSGTWLRGLARGRRCASVCSQCVRAFAKSPWRRRVNPKMRCPTAASVGRAARSASRRKLSAASRADPNSPRNMLCTHRRVIGVERRLGIANLGRKLSDAREGDFRFFGGEALGPHDGLAIAGLQFQSLRWPIALAAASRDLAAPPALSESSIALPRCEIASAKAERRRAWSPALPHHSIARSVWPACVK